MNKSFILLLFLSCALSLNLAGQEKSITPELLKKIKSFHQDNASTKAITNAVTANDITKLALNWENVGKIDEHFAHKLDVKGITNQKSSGRCWLFTGLNVIRPHVIKKYNLKKFYFSQDYSFFWDQLEKANLFLEGVIETSDREMDDRLVEWLFKHPISDGGVWNGFVNVVEKYGVVPYDIMPDSYSGENTRTMSRLIRRKLKEDGLQLRTMAAEGKSPGEIRETKTGMLGERSLISSKNFLKGFAAPFICLL